ncbi:MAG TPA: nucleotidyltransferase family protein [Bryobacteraceae bacterium]
MRTFEEQLGESFAHLLKEADLYFEETGKLHSTLEDLARRLEEAGISYAVLGAIAMARYGYRRMTVDIDLLLSPEGLARFRERYEGRGYVPAFGATQSFRATDTGVRIDVTTSGEYPGDGKPKPVAFPEPSQVSVDVDGISVVKLDKLVELKLASGISAPHRLRDLADVQDAIRTLRLPENFAECLDASVRAAYRDLWSRAQTPDLR